MLFMGGLWYALSILGLGLTYCIVKAAYDSFYGHGADHH